MISERDIQDYLHQIMAIEQKMEDLYGKLSVEVTMNLYRRIFQKLIAEEQDHQVHIQTVLKTFALSSEGNKDDLGNCILGQPAPAFSAPAALDNRIVNVSYANGVLKVDQDVLEGRYVVLLFYPMDFTFVCPTEIIAFDNALTEFAKLDATILGISVDTVYTHLAFKNTPREKRGLGTIRFPILSDITRRISRDYGVLLNDGVAARGTFIIDDKGILQSVSLQNLNVGRSIAEVLRSVEAYQTVARTGEFCPANWNPGETTISGLLAQAESKG
jgi:alkyl hydroperoxide reductase subunit AhpC